MDEKLTGLQELALPEPVTYMPQTAGWYLLAAALLLGIVLLVGLNILQSVLC